MLTKERIKELGESGEMIEGCAGRCPVCGTLGQLQYETILDAGNDTGFYAWECGECNAEGQEHYTLSFIGHTID